MYRSVSRVYARLSKQKRGARSDVPRYGNGNERGGREEGVPTDRCLSFSGEVAVLCIERSPSPRREMPGDLEDFISEERNGGGGGRESRVLRPVRRELWIGAGRESDRKSSINYTY